MVITPGSWREIIPVSEAAPSSKRRLATQLVHGGTVRSAWGETSEALILTSGFVYERAENAEARFKNEEPGFQYSRFGNPTVSMFEERMALLEGAPAAKATATGMAAVFAALMCQLRAGDHVLAARAMFGSCRFIVEDLLPRYGIASTLIDGKDNDAWRAGVRPNTKVLFFETPSNPTLELVDVAEDIVRPVMDGECVKDRLAIAIIREATALRDEFGIPEDVAAMALKTASLWEATLS